MSLQIVGSGFGRTGTHSLKLALETLGFGPCHHMSEVFLIPGQLAYWQRAASGHLPNWDRVFAGYAACVDWPASRFGREIAAHFPDAKVLHSVRPADKWIESVHATIYSGMRDRSDMPDDNRRAVIKMVWQLVVRQIFDGRLDDHDYAMAVFRNHIEEVCRTIAPERLLVYDVAEGWAPLSAFLDVAVPEVAFPRSNTVEEFQARVAALNAKS